MARHPQHFPPSVDEGRYTHSLDSGAQFHKFGFISFLSCEACGELYGNKSLRRKHILKHIKIYKCHHPLCARSYDGFASHNDLERHLRTVHKSGIERCWKCAFQNCSQRHKGKRFDRKDNFKAHIKRRHGKLNKEEMDELVKKSERQPSPLQVDATFYPYEEEQLQPGSALGLSSPTSETDGSAGSVNSFACETETWQESSSFLDSNPSPGMATQSDSIVPDNRTSFAVQAVSSAIRQLDHVSSLSTSFGSETSNALRQIGDHTASPMLDTLRASVSRDVQEIEIIKNHLRCLSLGLDHTEEGNANSHYGGMYDSNIDDVTVDPYFGGQLGTMLLVMEEFFMRRHKQLLANQLSMTNHPDVLLSQLFQEFRAHYNVVIPSSLITREVPGQSPDPRSTNDQTTPTWTRNLSGEGATTSTQPHGLSCGLTDLHIVDEESQSASRMEPLLRSWTDEEFSYLSVDNVDMSGTIADLDFDLASF